jgi:phosphinothricin acetyltransferase
VPIFDDLMKRANAVEDFLVTIRPAEQSDLEAIADIYNEVLASSTAIYRDTPTTLEERAEWWNSQGEKGYPVLVAEADGVILGFASFGDFRPWPGYRFTVEGTIHLRPQARRQGTGTILLRELISQAKSLGKHMLIAGVDAENAASLHFLAKMGFEQTAHLREVGYKFGRYLDLILLQYKLS